MIVKALNAVMLVIGGAVLICLIFMGWLAFEFPVSPPSCDSKGKVSVERIRETLTSSVQRDVPNAQVKAITIHACDPFDQQKIGNWDIRNCVVADIEYEIVSFNSASENAVVAQHQANQRTDGSRRESRHMLFTPCGDILFSAYD
jgi:hypothetical protein